MNSREGRRRASLELRFYVKLTTEAPPKRAYGIQLKDSYNLGFRVQSWDSCAGSPVLRINPDASRPASWELGVNKNTDYPN